MRLFWGALFYYPNGEKSKNNRSFIFIPLVLGEIFVFAFFSCVTSESKKGDVKMDTNVFDSKLEQSFDSFCKKVIKNGSKNILKKYKRLSDHEINLSSLSSSEMQKLASTDLYSEYEMAFIFGGAMLIVHDPDLARAISYLSPKWREVILLSFFAGYTDAQIGRELNVTKETIKYRKDMALDRLKEMLEGIENDKG